ncbi:hypothetical protein [Syntrophomonas palmitatica]|uniref:hypothetical protein n=1 Tax=Syntrophomonas palmitatica TaxID=402877 RepID=UPI0006CFA73B|nr:hypothetical protein [Syntrophomonas palmitatica]
MAVINRPGWYSAAVWLDDAGLLERAVTALENRDKSDGISRLQYQDALQYIKRFNPQTQPYRWSKKRLGLSAAAAALVLIMAIIPNPQQFEAEQQEMVRREALRQKHKIEKVRKKMEQANKAAPLAKREDTIKSLQELERQLERARNLNQGLKAVAQTQDHLMKLQTPRAVSDTQHLAAVLKQQEMTEALGQKIAAGDVRGSREASEKLLDNAAAMTAQQRQAAASELSQQAVHLTPAASQLVQMLARAVRSGQGAAASPAVINQLSSAAGQAAGISALNQALAVSADARQALLKAGAVPGAQLAVNGSSGDAEAVPVPCATGQEGGCGKNDRGASNTSGLGTTGSQNISQGNANGGSGQGSGGGAGQGSGQGSNNRGKESSPNSAPAAKGQPAAKFGNYEKIYDPVLSTARGKNHRCGARPQGSGAKHRHC